MLKQCYKSGNAGVGRPGPTKFDMGSVDVQGQHSLPILDVSKTSLRSLPNSYQLAS